MITLVSKNLDEIIDQLRLEFRKTANLLIRTNHCLGNFTASCPCPAGDKCRNCSEATKVSEEIEELCDTL